MIQKTTEKSSLYDHLEQMSTHDLLENINNEDHKVPQVIKGIIPQIEQLVDKVYEQMHNGGRLFYIGSGTSGRLGIVDASECPPTYGVPSDWVIGVIAGGDKAIRSSIERAEDDTSQGWKDLSEYHINSGDFLVGITASGTTPYVLGAVDDAKRNGVPTGCITCNAGSPLEDKVDFPIVAVVGPEFVTGSTRMKSGTAQKLILNMISTSVMVKLGRVKGNKMVDMQLSNDKLVGRGIKMVMEETGVSESEAKALLETQGSVRLAIAAFRKGNEAR